MNTSTQRKDPLTLLHNMQDTQKDRDHYSDEPPPLPEYDISPSLKKLVLLCIGTTLINFLVAGACAIAMRILQIDAHLRTIAHLGHLPVPPVPFKEIQNRTTIWIFGSSSLSKMQLTMKGNYN